MIFKKIQECVISFCNPKSESVHKMKSFLCLFQRLLKGKGGDLAATDKHGWSVLQYAVRYAAVPAVEALVDLGCDIHHRERKGWTCLHLAARNGHPEKARLLLERGADVHTTQNQGNLKL